MESPSDVEGRLCTFRLFFAWSFHFSESAERPNPCLLVFKCLGFHRSVKVCSMDDHLVSVARTLARKFSIQLGLENVAYYHLRSSHPCCPPCLDFAALKPRQGFGNDVQDPFPPPLLIPLGAL